MSAIHWLLVVLRRLGSSLARISIRALLRSFSVVYRATKRFSSDTTTKKENHRVCDESPPAILSPLDSRTTPASSVDCISASLMPHRIYGPSASRSSQDIGALPIQESYLLHNPSVQDLHSRPPSPNVSISIEPSEGDIADLPLSSRAQSTHSAATHSSEIVATTPFLNEVDSSLYPGTPEVVRNRRYDKQVLIPNEPTRYTIDALTTSPFPLQLPEGWTPCTHPEGAQFYFHGERQIYTDSNILDDEIFDVIAKAIDTIDDFKRAHNILLEPSVDLVLDAYPEWGCQYYFVNNQTRWIFWMDNAESDILPITSELHGIKSASSMHTRHELEAQYWQHCHLFPRPSDLTHEKIEEFRDHVICSLEDRIISPTSTVPWTTEQLTYMLHLADGFSRLVGSKSTRSTSSLSRLMHSFVRERVYNFHGEPHARLDSKQSVYSTIQKRTKLIAFLNPLFFYTPDPHLVGLQTIFRDGLIRYRNWSEFILRLSQEWQELTNYGIFVLNASVSFLSIQSVDQGGNVAFKRSPAQIAGYLSISASAGSIILALLLLKKTRHRDRENPAEAASFIASQIHPTLGLEKLAILYSLPYALFIWSMLLFLLALSFMCFQHSDVITHVLVGLLCVVVGVLTVWCILNSLEGSVWGWLEWPTNTADPTDAEEFELKPIGEESASAPSRPRWPWSRIVFRKDSDQHVV
ncbi:hypothetical protein DFH07DRAFT_837908 [Mycena maculata]|uniref:WW domain-containing protein n=1 Tax=Mycena maculata TaxID=230809 RepID=A0AAD7N2C6_9AGAR|nr:hypothetical protein DFH07DRAFT_837908 [Mycena maculata]